VELEDRITIVTPEGIELSLQLAGIGSRFIAGVADLFVQLVLIGLVVLVGGGIENGFGVALVALGAFAALYVYDVAFEVLGGGQTPGKRLTHLRVVRRYGEPIDLPASAVRNLIRLLEGPALAYLPALGSIAISPRNQRLGDLAAGSLVIRVRAVRRGGQHAVPSPTGIAGPGERPAAGAVSIEPGERWDVSAVSAEELGAVMIFLARRAELDPRARHELAARLEGGLRGKLAGAPEQVSGERFLEQLVAAKAGRED